MQKVRSLVLCLGSITLPLWGASAEKGLFTGEEARFNRRWAEGIHSGGGISFLFPNERITPDSQEAFSHVKDGTLISVGTFRGFNHFAMSNATRLLLVDYDPNAVAWNLDLIVLLKNIAEKFPDKDLATKRAAFIEGVRNIACKFDTLLKQHRCRSSFTEQLSSLEFAPNFWSDEKLFEKILKAAEEDRIAWTCINLFEPTLEWSFIVGSQSQSPIIAIDCSNIFDYASSKDFSIFRANLLQLLEQGKNITIFYSTLDRINLAVRLKDDKLHISLPKSLGYSSMPKEPGFCFQSLVVSMVADQ